MGNGAVIFYCVIIALLSAMIGITLKFRRELRTEEEELELMAGIMADGLAIIQERLCIIEALLEEKYPGELEHLYITQDKGASCPAWLKGIKNQAGKEL